MHSAPDHPRHAQILYMFKGTVFDPQAVIVSVMIEGLRQTYDGRGWWLEYETPTTSGISYYPPDY